ncbi:hypothetical protein F443_12108 [Phytophthora nicotianae P1569]|uniref:SET domain-containing protein n=1 Tax=Phytophthora nicotianae P1569 TaxID=1317065 RepID=V9EWJ8_PHYNI|nr:hypothetical protein F443_12108 [Phytophthora nicotianae P1569]
MVHLVHSALYWKLRCIQDSSASEDENTPPNVSRTQSPEDKTAKQKYSDDECCGNKGWDATSLTGTATPPWMSPGFTKLSYSRSNTNPPPSSPSSAPSPSSAETVLSPSRRPLEVASPPTSSPVMLETTPRPSPLVGSRTKGLQNRRSRREGATPYSRPRLLRDQKGCSVANPSGCIRAANVESSGPKLRSHITADMLVPVRWPYDVAHLLKQYNPMATVFPAVPNFGLCNCQDPCRFDTCRNALMNVYCNINCCPYEGMCGNGLRESNKVYLVRNLRTSTLGVAVVDDIEAGEVVGQYLGELEHLSMNRSVRPRNTGYRLVMRQRPERPEHPVLVAINAERMGGLMRFVNHSCEPVAKFVEVGNGRRTTVVVVTTERVRRGQEITADHGADLWIAAILSDVVCEGGEDIEGFKLKDSTRITKAAMFSLVNRTFSRQVGAASARGFAPSGFAPTQVLHATTTLTPSTPLTTQPLLCKNSGSANYKVAEVNRLLDLVEQYLPLGKDEWERLASDFNSTRPRSWAERDFDSLRRTFKALYSTRKPTGKANIPPHIERAKDLKRAVDDKANVIEMDDCVKEDRDEEPDEENEEEEERAIEPDFSFNYEPDDTLFPDRDAGGSTVDIGTDAQSGASLSTSTGLESSVDAAEIAAHSASKGARGNAHPVLDVRHQRALCARQDSEGGKPPRAANTTKPKARKTKSGQRPDNHEGAGGRGFNDLQASSNRLGGGDLRIFRVRLVTKRSSEEGDLESAEASFAKAKRMRAVLATEALQQKLAKIQQASSSLGGSMMELVLIMREENELKAEARRAEEDECRRDELAAREEHYQAEKKDAEERRRQESLE